MNRNDQASQRVSTKRSRRAQSSTTGPTLPSTGLALHALRSVPGARRAGFRKGRGPGSTLGKTAGRGHKGQHARNTVARGFEGGQTPLRRRLPRRGFSNHLFRRRFQIVNLGRLARIADLDKVTELHPQLLHAQGMIPRAHMAVKVLAMGNWTRSLRIHAHAFSRAAEERIRAAGGEAIRIPIRPAANARKQEHAHVAADASRSQARERTRDA